METIDDDAADRAADFIQRQTKADKPFFVWVNFTHIHFRTHIKPKSMGQSKRWQSEYHDAMIDHDKNVGTVLKAIDDAGIADNTFVMYSTDNGPHMNSWPDGAMTPFRNEKNSNWEGAYRVPCMVRWPGKIKPGTVSNEIVGHHDWLPTFLAMAGDKEVKHKLLNGYKLGDMNYKVHLDGDNLIPFLAGQTDKSPRESFIYCNEDQQVTGLRFDNWKLVFMEQQLRGTMEIWAEPFITLRLPKMFNLRTDTYERADVTANTYYDWLLDHVFLMVHALMFEAASEANMDVDRLSFKGSFQILKTRLPECDPSNELQFSQWYAAVLWEIRRERIPPRRNRINPRVIKRKMSRWNKCHPKHRKQKPLTKTFGQTVVMLH